MNTVWIRCEFVVKAMPHNSSGSRSKLGGSLFNLNEEDEDPYRQGTFSGRPVHREEDGPNYCNNRQRGRSDGILWRCGSDVPRKLVLPFSERGDHPSGGVPREPRDDAALGGHPSGDGRFCLFTALGAGIWVTVLAFLGYLVGNNQEQITQVLHKYTLYIGLFLGVIVLLYIGWHRARRKKGEEE